MTFQELCVRKKKSVKRMQQLAHGDECKCRHSWLRQGNSENRSYRTKTKRRQRQVMVGKSAGAQQRALAGREENKSFLYLYVVRV